MKAKDITLSPLRLLKQGLSSEFVQKIVAGLGSRAIVILLGLLVSIFIARHLGPDGRGQFAVAWAIIGLGMQLGLLGFQSSNTYYVAKNRELLATMLSNTWLISSVLGGITMVIIYYARHLIQGGEGLPFPMLIVTLLSIPIYICFLMIEGLLAGVQKFKQLNFGEILNKALTTMLIFILLGFGTLSPIKVLIFHGVAAIITTIFMAASLRENRVSFTLPSFSLIKQQFQYGSKAYFCCLFSWAITRIDVFVMKHYSSFEEIGYYSIALSIIDLMLMLSYTVGNILLPKLCGETDIQKRWTIAKNTTLGTSLVVIGVAIVVFLWGAPIRWVYGENFTISHQVLKLLLPGFVLLSAKSVLIQFVNSTHLSWSIVLLSATSVGIKLLTSILWIPKMGFTGIGMSWTATYLFVLLSLYATIMIHLKKQMSPYEAESSGSA